jgi:flagellar basal body rod protein FlgB
MSSDITTEVIRLAMRVAQLKAETASENISQSAFVVGSKRLDTSFSDVVLAGAVDSNASENLLNTLRTLNDMPLKEIESNTPVNLDEEVVALSSANLEYTALVEALNKRFGLMRLAITGKGQ